MKELSENVKAIDVVRQMVADGQVSKDVAEKYFPELAESEDEKIRKKLIEVVKGDMVVGGTKDKQLAIAWLEKQSEQIHANSAKTCKDEQKPIPKFEVGDVMRTLQEAADNITSGLPVVVSIDDEYYRCNNELIAIKDQNGYEYPPMNRIQKQEWSEEDEKIIQWIATDIKRLINDNKKANIIADQEIKWLESLRPRSQWKPSDEQIMALRWVLNHIPYDSHKEEISGLLEQLKKLREE